MYTVEALLPKHRDKIIMVDKKKDPIDVLKDLTDIQEIDLNVIPLRHLKRVTQNIKYHEDYNGSPIKLHFYKVIRNKKSELYYKELEETQIMTYKAFFEESTVYVFYEETFGLQETNSNLLHQDHIILCGVTQEDLQEKNQYLFHYLSYINAWEELKNME